MWLLKLKEMPSLTFSTFTSIWKGLISPTTVQATLMNAIRGQLANYNLYPVLPTDPAVALIAGQIRASNQLPKYKTVLIAHSQGTAYAVEVMNRLIKGVGLQYPVPAGSISMVSLGAAAGGVKGPSASHATSYNDFVIGALRTFSIPVGFTVLGNNITIPLLSSDWLGHNLIRVYMGHSVGQQAYITRLKTALNAVKSPAPPTPAMIRMQPWGMICGTTYYPGPQPNACNFDVPTGAPYQWHMNVNINIYNVTSIPTQQHTFGSQADLDALGRAHLMGCYNWWLADRTAVIKSFTSGYMPLSQYDYPYHLHSGSCGAGFPWQTPYGNPDAAHLIYSADSYKITVTNTSDAGAYYTKVDMVPVCNRAT